MTTELQRGHSLVETPEWWDAVAPEGWDEIVVSRDGRDLARFPFVVRKRLGIRKIGMPPLTPWSGPYFADQEGKLATRLQREISLGEEIARLLPRADIVEFVAPPETTNLFGFSSAGFRLSATYTYRIDLEQTEEALWESLLPRVRQNVRKAERVVAVEVDDQSEDLIRMVDMTFARQGREVRSWAPVIHRIHEAFQPLGRATILTARSAAGEVHASMLGVGDGRQLIYLIGGADPSLRSSNAQSLLIWHAIRSAREHAPVFDFAGSMTPAIAHFFVAFGGHQIVKLAALREGSRARAAKAAQAGIAQLIGRR